jgi:outer membrane protein assembly factor BamB
MRRLVAPLAAVLLVPALSLSEEGAFDHWPTWRGPTGNGVSPDGTPPLHWGESENVRWKVALPGLGSASPIVWGDRIYVLSASPADPAALAAQHDAARKAREGGERPPRATPIEHSFIVSALSRQDGSVVWQRTVLNQVPHEGHHPDNTWASGSPVTDGEVLVAHFGSRGTFAFDLDGNPLWQKDLGDMQTRMGFGEGTTPALYEDRVIINWDHEGDSFIVALDKTSGQELWRQSREEVTSWATPLVVEVDGRAQVIVPATGRSRAYDVETGEEIWSLAGMTLNTIPSPIYEDGVLYLTSGFRGNMFQAIALEGAAGELEGTDHLLWSFDRDTPYVPSALLYGGQLYFFKRFGNVLTSLAPEDGSVVYQVRVEGVTNVWASPIGAAGRIYFIGRDGAAAVIAPGPEFRVLATNRLDDRFDATPAIVDNEMYLRGRNYLYCIAEDGS